MYTPSSPETSTAEQSAPETGFVIIGRNEGDRLKAGIRAIQTHCPSAPVVYVDSGSSDDSVAFAQSVNVDVVELDLSIPFTAARARNAGFERILSRHADLKFVQFMDGDCELQAGWIEPALNTLKSDDKTGIVSGRRVEKFPEASIYNTLMDIEWNTPVGEAHAVLGDMCVKVELFQKIGGFAENIIAAEDDDLCLRARREGYKIYRIDAVMSHHDANIMCLPQWYRRSKRGGHGYANINYLHGNGLDKHFRKELRSVAFWGGLVPTAFFVSLFVLPIAAGMLLAVYLLFILKIAVRRKRMGNSSRVALAYGALILTGKIPELLGFIQFWKNKLLSRKHELIEYK